MSSSNSISEYFPIIESVESQFGGDNLPNASQVFKVFLYKARCLKLHIKIAARDTIREIKIFWENANVKTQRDDKCEKKLLSLYEEYQVLLKHLNRSNNCAKQEC